MEILIGLGLFCLFAFNFPTLALVVVTVFVIGALV
jgi:hypothetical protein